MLNTNTNTQQSQSLKEHIWEGSVGVCIELRENRKTGETFFTFEPVRCFRREGSDQFEYSHTFTDRNVEALKTVIDKAMARINGAESASETGNSVEK